MTFSLRLSAALAAGKVAGLASRVLRRGGGTTMPGVVARRVAPDTLRQLSARLPQGVIVVGGTNGKTTTVRMIAAILQDDGRQLLHNRAGANLLSGLTSTALAGASLSGRVRAEIGLFETDEAALPDALAETQPRLVLLPLMIPGAVTFIPGYVLVASLGWINTLRGLIVPGLFSSFAALLFRQFYLDFPRDLEYAGRVDGLNAWGCTGDWRCRTRSAF